MKYDSGSAPPARFVLSSGLDDLQGLAALAEPVVLGAGAALKHESRSLKGLL